MKTWLSEDPGVPVAGNQSAEAIAQDVAAAEPSNGQEASSTLSTATSLQGSPTQDVAVADQPAATPVVSTAVTNKKQPSARSLLGRFGAQIVVPIWRTRGLWLGGTGIGIAMFAQKVLTVDGPSHVVESIRWYALAIFVMLVAWLGTYKNKSLIAEPTPQVRRIAAFKTFFARLRATQTSTQTAQPAPIAPSSKSPAATTLPVRAKRTVPQTQTSLPTRAARDGKQAIAVPIKAEAVAPVAEAVTTRVTADAASKSGDGTGRDTLPQAAPEKARRFNPPWLPAWHRLTARYSFLAGPWPRYVIAALALILNLYSADQLRKDYFSPVGGFGWLLSLLILAAAFIRERKKPVLPADPHVKDIEDRTRLRLPRRVEVGIFLSIFLLAFGLRLFRLDDWTGAMHGDEGEFGMNAISIVNGDRISPFMTGWFFHPNFSFFGIAAMMKIFGTGLFGLRILSALLGALMVIPFYLLVRMWFGVRMAIIASLLLSFMDVSLYFGKLGLNNIETPFFIVLGLYFFFKGVRSLKTLDFILAGYAFMLTLYFYFGGRLTPFLVIAIVAYMFLIMPILRLPGAYFDTRRREPHLQRAQALGRAALHQLRGVGQYVGKIIIFAVACVCLASPWLVYFQDHQNEMNTRANEKLIFNPGNIGVITQQTGAIHGPLYLGLRMPTESDVYPFLPVVFEQTPASIKLTDDGFWPRVLWTQTTKSLSMFTYRKDESSFYTFTFEPAAKPIEAALLILGIAWALWRWRDTRMAVLSMWFWLTIVAGGALTIDAPYMPRLVGLVPALAIFIAIPLNKMAAEMVGAFGAFGRAKRWVKMRLRMGVAISGAALAVLLLYLGFQNVYDYFSRYLASQPNREHAGTANFVRWMNDKAASEGRPKPQYYDMAHPFYYWGYGINRFLNQGTQGTDLNNPTNELPILNNDDRDVVFMVWDYTRQYLPVFEAYYPGGEKADYLYGPESSPSRPFVYYRVKREQIEARRRSLATYTPSGGGPAIQREEEGVGSGDSPPPNLQYPISATWTTNIVAPSAGSFRFALDAPGDGSLIIDGQPFLATSAGSTHIEGELALARGPHEITLTGALADAAQKVKLEWTTGGTAFTPVPRQYLWNGPGRGLLGEIRSLGSGDLLAEDGTRILTARVDGFLGFRDSPAALSQGAIKASWRGTIDAPQAGSYNFSVNSNGDSLVLIDGEIVVSNVQGGGSPHEASGQVELTQGPHQYELRYNWSNGAGYLEAYWIPPGGERSIITPGVLHASGGILDPNSLESALPPVQLKPEPPAAKIEPDAVIGAGDGLLKAKGVAVDGEGNIYVGDRGNHKIVVYSPDGKRIREWGKPPPEVKEGQPVPEHQGGELREINDVAVTKDGTVYVFDDTPRVQAFKTNGEYIGSLEQGQLNLYGPNGIAEAVPSTGNEGKTLGLYIAVTGQNRVLKLPSISDVLSGKATPLNDIENATGTEGDKLEQPVDAVADPSGADVLYAIDLKERVVQFKPKSETPSPTREWGVSAQWRVPIGKEDGGSRLGISPDGKRVYMSDPDRRRVAVLDIASGEVSYFGREGGGPGEFGRPSGIAVGPDGRIYVVDSVRNNVQVFSPEKVGK
ncbi:MAG TPA: PA14 domain-containing protein [Chloroflexia bacterium]|nr:PA14 domain-containing protein [Chloroflexia bacterium]